MGRSQYQIGTRADNYTSRANTDSQYGQSKDNNSRYVPKTFNYQFKSKK